MNYIYNSDVLILMMVMMMMMMLMMVVVMMTRMMMIRIMTMRKTMWLMLAARLWEVLPIGKR